ncbi:hypothetical protein [Pseudodesulfovibrio indicus]|uniref:hypothetical protein n=1 Tax=Pseudodesulfovibrio indicus TaxID=1716143 RepID=UPI00292EA406|nr:hypothetical protein [Pseudodesulfovibrio indicus]
MINFMEYDLSSPIEIQDGYEKEAYYLWYQCLLRSEHYRAGVSLLELNSFTKNPNWEDFRKAADYYDSILGKDFNPRHEHRDKPYSMDSTVRDYFLFAIEWFRIPFEGFDNFWDYDLKPVIKTLEPVLDADELLAQESERLTIRSDWGWDENPYHRCGFLNWLKSQESPSRWSDRVNLSIDPNSMPLKELLKIISDRIKECEDKLVRKRRGSRWQSLYVNEITVEKNERIKGLLGIHDLTERYVSKKQMVDGAFEPQTAYEKIAANRVKSIVANLDTQDPEGVIREDRRAARKMIFNASNGFFPYWDRVVEKKILV